MMRNNEVLTEPKVEILVHSARPEARAYTIDGVSLPDFDAFNDGKMSVHDVNKYFLIRQNDVGLTAESYQLPHDTHKYVGDDEMSTFKAWAVESVDALKIPIPTRGLPIKFMLGFLFGPVSEAQSNSNNWHVDMGLGALTVFENDATEIMDEVMQDTYPRDKITQFGILDTKFTDYVEQSIEAHIKQPENGQTAYVGPRNIHRQPLLIPSQIRRGIICAFGGDI